RHDELVDHVDELLEALEEDISQFSSIPDFSYRRQLGRAAISSMCEDLSRRSTPADEFSGDYLQLYTEWSQGESDACGRPLATQSSDRYTTGEAVYVDDMKIKDLTHAGVVVSSKAHAKILKDIPKGGTNYPGKLAFNVLGADDTPMFADGSVLAVGQVIGVVVAEDLQTARRAAMLVKVHYEELPAVLTM
ncbi:hypothetical protein GCK32_016954, partial [Trichostrongylus colubriformis]